MPHGNVTVSLSDSFNRAPHSSDDVIDKIWDARCAANPSLYNGSKFRFQSIDLLGAGAHLKLGFTNYKEFLATNCSPSAEDLYRSGGHTHMSDALGVGALLVTKDAEVVLILRSTRCGEDQGKWDTPGETVCDGQI